MATNFPASLDSLTNPTSSDSLSSPSHSAQHANANDAIEALQAKVGADSSAVTSSLDYKVAQLESDVAGFTSGKILQVVSTTKTDTFSTTNTTFTDVTGLTVSITPSSASSKVLVIVNLVFGYSGTGAAHIKLNGGNISSYVGDAAGNRVRGVSNVYTNTGLRNDLVAWNQPMLYLDSPATTSSTTYAAQIRVGSTGTVYVNRSEEDADTVEYVRGASTITVMEVSA